MVFLDADSPAMPELDTFLAEWGLAFEQKKVFDYENSLSVDGSVLIAEAVAEGVGASFTNAIRKLENPPKIVVDDAKPITFTYESKPVGYGGRVTGAVLTTSSDRTAGATSLIGGEREEGKIYNLMAVSVESISIDNETHSSYILAAGTTAFADDSYVGSSSYANRDIIFNAMRSFGKKAVPLDLDCKFFENTELSITKGEANRLTVLCTLFLPAVAAGVGIYVYVRRRYL